MGTIIPGITVIRTRDQAGTRQRGRSQSWLAGLIVLVVLGALFPGQALGQSSPAQELADKYAPVTYLRQQEHPCDRDGEGYFPAPVEAVLGNPDVALKVADTDSSHTDTIITMGPTAQDLAGLDETHYLDFPGNPRRPGCTYEADFKQLAADFDLQPTTYAHIVVDEARDKVVIQYWLWYYFNDWNNLHESDWEMIEVVFDASSVEEALTQEPALYAYAQHGGGELADPDSDKLSLEDGHPVIYPTAGSHASHYDASLFIGWGENGTGFGCDNATGPHNRVPLQAILVPTDPDPDGPFGWVHFAGRWGERQPWEYDGPVNPGARPRWTDPVPELDGWRDSSLTVPDSSFFGPTVTDTFCTLSRQGSLLIMYADTYSTEIVLGAVAVLILIAMVLVRMRRPIWEALALYVRHWRVFIGIGLGAIPIGIVFNLIQIGLSRFGPFDWFLRWFDNTASGTLILSLLIGSFQHLAMLLLVVPALIQAIADIDRGMTPGVFSSYRRAAEHLSEMVAATVITVIVSGLLLATIIGSPLVTWLLVRWQFYPQATILDDAPDGIEALTISARAVRKRWMRTFLNTVLFYVLAFAPGPIIGMILLLAGETSVWGANAVSGVVYAVVIPIAIVGLTVYYQRIDRVESRQ